MGRYTVIWCGEVEREGEREREREVREGERDRERERADTYEIKYVKGRKTRSIVSQEMRERGGVKERDDSNQQRQADPAHNKSQHCFDAPPPPLEKS